MWKKDEATPGVERQPQAGPRTEAPRPRTTTTAAPGEVAVIGRSIIIKGEVSGDEDLLIQGQVDGSVDLDLQSVTVGREGRVKANITGRVVTVEGEVDGDLKAQEQVILRSSARVHGDITAPRVVLEDGASFRGLVDMGESPAAKEQGTTSSTREGSASSSGSRTTETAAKTNSGNSNSTSDKDNSASSSDKAKTKDASTNLDQATA